MAGTGSIAAEARAGRFARFAVRGVGRQGVMRENPPPVGASSYGGAIQERDDACCQIVWCTNLALPKRKHIPSSRSEPLLISSIAALIALQFWPPVLDSRFGDVGPRTALVLMPKAALNLDDFRQARENEIWSTRKCLNVQSIAKSHRMHEPSNSHLRRRVSTTDTPHVCTSLNGGEPIQRLSPSVRSASVSASWAIREPFGSWRQSNPWAAS